MLQSFFSVAIAPYTFLRESPLTLFVRGSAGSGRRVFIYCEFLTGESTPFKGSCLLADVLSAHGIHGSVRVRPTGRDLKLPVATRIEQPGELLIDVSLFLVYLFDTGLILK